MTFNNMKYFFINTFLTILINNLLVYLLIIRILHVIEEVF